MIANNVKTRFRIGVYGILCRDDRVLMTHSLSSGGPILNFPGGALELGESLREGVTREFKEETGLRVTVNELLFVTEMVHTIQYAPECQPVYFYFSVTTAEDPVRQALCADVQDIEWIRISELGDDPRMIPPDTEFWNAWTNHRKAVLKR